MLWDTHIHTSFSYDSESAPEDMIQRAIELGLDGICITDHLDLDFPEEPEYAPLDQERYTAQIPRFKEKFSGTFPVCFGVEVGLQPHLAATHRDFLAAHDFDFVIGSSHLVDGRDPYFPDFYEGRSQRAAYLAYFESILDNILAFDAFDVYGHLDYVVRYGPDRNENYSYAQYQEILDEILRLLIARGKGIEVNTAGFRYGLGHPHPTEEIIRRYRALGGEIITIGSDAHSPDEIAWAFDRVPGMLRDCGFSYYTIFRDRKPEFLQL